MRIRQPDHDRQASIGAKDASTRPAEQTNSKFSDLEPGDYVSILAEDRHATAAYIDTVGPDGRILWLVELNSGQRRLILNEDPVELRKL